MIDQTRWNRMAEAWLLLTIILTTEVRYGSALTEQDILNSIFNVSTYDRKVGPYTISGNPTEISIDFVILGLGPVNELNMEYSMSMYFRQQWVDLRLQHPEWNRSIQTNYRRLDQLWVPDTFFPEAKTEMRHEVTIPNLFIRIEPDGTIIYSQRLSVTMACLMDLRKFPLDKQTCSFRMESYGYTTKEVLLAWSSSRKFNNVLPSTNIPDFELLAITAHDCTAKLQTGDFPCLYANLELKRQIGFYLTQTYIPSILIVALSWVSFWIDPNAIPARISVGLLTVLTITTQSSGARSQLPRVPYTKSIDVWMSACLVFVFAAYIEYAFVTVLSRHYRKTASSTQDNDSSKDSMISSTSSVSSVFSRSMDDLTELRQRNGKFSSGGNSKASLGISFERDFGRTVDKFSRYFFPSSFTLFNVCYWVYYIELG